MVEDCYNSNPSAAEKALESAARLSGRRHWAVLGAMRELGPDTPRFHAELGRQAAAAGFSPIVGVGEESRELVAAARAGGAEAEWIPDATAAAARFAGELQAGDVVLVKGSRSVGLEAVVRAFVERGKATADRVAPGGGRAEAGR